MKICVFIISLVLALIRSKVFPDFLTAIFWLAMVISGASMIYEQRKKR